MRHNGQTMTREQLIEKIKNATEDELANFVEVVRCKDCKNTTYVACPMAESGGCYDDEFCSWGGKK